MTPNDKHIQKAREIAQAVEDYECTPGNNGWAEERDELERLVAAALAEAESAAIRNRIVGPSQDFMNIEYGKFSNYDESHCDYLLDKAEYWEKAWNVYRSNLRIEPLEIEVEARETLLPNAKQLLPSLQEFYEEWDFDKNVEDEILVVLSWVYEEVEKRIEKLRTAVAEYERDLIRKKLGDEK